jgi:hypothetical protein
MNLKDPGKGHFYVSLVKSVLRIGAGVFLYTALPGNLFLMVAAVLLIAAEVLGIIEELV